MSFQSENDSALIQNISVKVQLNLNETQNPSMTKIVSPSYNISMEKLVEIQESQMSKQERPVEMVQEKINQKFHLRYPKTTRR